MLRFAVLLLVLWLGSSRAVARSQTNECLARGEYFGLDLPGPTPEIFAPGLASTHHHDDWFPLCSPDGREVLLRINGKISGEIIGVLFRSVMDETDCWSVPLPLPFSGRYPDGAVVFSPDGSHLYFTSKRPVPGESQQSERSRVWQVDRLDQGWGEPILLDSPINQHNVNGGLGMAADGTLYVAMEAPMGAGGLDIYELAPAGGGYLEFAPLRGPINTQAVEVGPFIDPEQRFLINDYESKFAGLSPDGRVLFFVSHRQVDESNPLARWSLDLFEDLAIEDNADRAYRFLGGCLLVPQDVGRICASS